MDDATETAFLRIQGQISASQTMLAHLIKSSPESLNAAKAAVASIANVSEFLEHHGEQKMQIVGMGMREFLSALTDALDT